MYGEVAYNGNDLKDDNYNWIGDDSTNLEQINNPEPNNNPPLELDEWMAIFQILMTVSLTSMGIQRTSLHVEVDVNVFAIGAQQVEGIEIEEMEEEDKNSGVT